MGTVRATWNGNMQFSITDHLGRTVFTDTDPEHGGESSGILPKELMLMGLASCTGMDVISILRKKHQPVKTFEVAVRGQSREEPPKYYDQVWIEYVVHGDVDETALERAIDLSVEKYCAVYATMKHVAQIERRYRIVRE